jgi:hypothetical protein
MDKVLVISGIFFIVLGVFIVVPLPLNGSWLYYWEIGFDPWFILTLSISIVLLGLFLIIIGFKTSNKNF